MATICTSCHKVLTDKEGGRLESAIFDSSLAHLKKESTDDIIYAWCAECYEEVEKQSESRP